MDWINIIFGGIGILGVASVISSVIATPLALYRGFKNKNWKLFKILIIAFTIGILLWFGSMAVWGLIKS